MHWRPAILVSLIAVSVWATGPVAHADTVVNPISQFPITVDGLFTNANEWSDITPLAFISSADQLQPTPTSLTDPLANAFLYGAIASGTTAESDELYLMYDYKARTSNSFSPGEFVADIKFPITVGGNLTPITVEVRGAAQATGISGPNVATVPLFTFTIRKDQDGSVLPSTNIEGAGAFGISPNSSSSHLMIELEVPLLIPAGFSNVLPPSSDQSNGYSPNPAFWGSNIANDLGDPPATAAIFQINSNGTTTITSVPEPSTFGLLALVLGALSLRKLRRLTAL